MASRPNIIPRTAYQEGTAFIFVIAGLDPAIHFAKTMDPRVKPAGDD